MFESFARLVFELIQPTAQLVILLVVIAVLLFAGWRRRALQAFAVLFVLWLVYANPFLSGMMVDRLQNSYPVLDGGKLAELQILAESQEPVFVIVLGSGHTPDARLKPSQMLTELATMRLVEGIRVHRQLPGSRLVTSASVEYGNYTQAEAMRDAAIALGVDPDDIDIQPDPTTTCEEARAFVRDHGPGARVVVATSATHMRRAMMLFEQQGALPVAAPTAFIRKENPDKPFSITGWMPSLENIDDLEQAIKEYVGYIWDKRQC